MGSKVIDRFAQDLRVEFPGVEGFSARSLKYIRALAAAWPEESMCNSLLHNCLGATIFEFSIGSKTGGRGSGISAPHWSMTGARTFSFT